MAHLQDHSFKDSDTSEIFVYLKHRAEAKGGYS